MSKINYKIEEGTFSLVMKEIAAILLIEFTNQITLGNNFLPSEISYDTSSAVNEGDLPFVSVNWAKFDNKLDARAHSENLNDYYIDIKAVGQDNVRKIIAVIRSILKHQEYLTLGFEYGVISDTNITTSGIDLESIAMNKDSQGTVTGGVWYRANVVEQNPSTQGIQIKTTNYDLAVDDNKILRLTNNI